MNYEGTQAELADMFDQFANDQIASIRWQSSKAAKNACQLRAEVWKDAATIVRNTVLLQAKEPVA